MFAAQAAPLLGCSGTTRDVRRSQNELDLAKDYLGKADFAAAETQTKKALTYDPDSEEAYNVLGLIYSYRAVETVHLIERDDCLDGNDAAELRADASDLMRKADDQFKKAVEIAPDYGEAWQNRAVLAMQLKDWDKAVEYEEKALANLARLDSEPLARANLGWAYYQKHDYSHAAAELLQATESSNQQYFCLGNYRLASLYFARDEYQDALERLKPQLSDPKLCPPIQEAQYLGGEIFIRLHDPDQAATMFDACVDLAPKSCQARECKQALAGLSPSAP